MLQPLRPWAWGLSLRLTLKWGFASYLFATIQQESGNGCSPGSALGLLPSRCLQDARTLLRNLIAPPNDIAPHNNNNLEDSP